MSGYFVLVSDISLLTYKQFYWIHPNTRLTRLRSK